MTPIPIARWHELVARRDLGSLEELLAEGATFQSPVVHTPQVGKAITALYLRGAAMLLLNDRFRYVNEWYAERSAVLEFEAEVEGIAINGVDMIFWDEEGRIERFKVMIRPLKAIELLHAKMAALLAARGSGA